MKKLKHKIRELVLLFLEPIRREKVIRAWEHEGRPSPPPHEVKQRVVEEYQKKWGYHVLVETGTYFGDMLYAQRKNFKQLYSIELGENLWKACTRRFRRSKHISILHGDSARVLPSIVDRLREPAVFWLDGHYSGGETALGDKESPILEELEAIFASRTFDHVLLIDDARLFNGEEGYPTIDAVNHFVRSRDPEYECKVADDIIRCVISRER